MKTRCLGCMEEYDSDYGLCPSCGYEPDTDVDSPIHMKPGVLLHGQYLIGRVLGFGGFGVTYIGWDFKLQRKVAVKEYLPSEFATRLIGQTQVSVFGGNKEEQFSDGMGKFVEEAKRLAQFHSEDGIVHIYDSFSENNTAYIIMEYLEGETLQSYLERNGKIPTEEAIAMLTPVLKSLETVHKTGIIHRDIAPDNIYLTKDGQVKLIDFGAARYATTTHSRSLSVIIKRGYSPEEQYRSNGNQGPHTDVYAIAAVLYRMITGVILPDSLERLATLEQGGKDLVQSLSKQCQVTKNQEAAILNALNVQIDDRTPTAAQFLEELTTQRPVKRVFGRIRTAAHFPLWLKILVPAAGVVAAALLFLLGTGRIGPNSNLITDILLGENEVRVPGVVNSSVDQAESTLSDHGLLCQIVGTEYSDVIPANVVLYQTVLAGQVVERDTVVELYISTDQSPQAEVGIMPNLVYKPQAEAEALLVSLGLTAKVEEVFDDVVAAGVVAGQSVEPGTEVAEGTEVVLQVSQGVDPNKQEATAMTVVLSKTSYELYVGEGVTLRPEGGDGKYSFDSSNDKVVKVNRNGVLTAVGSGTATITVTSGDAQSAICKVTVKDYKMSLNRTSVSLFKDASATLSVSGIPSSAKVSWSSDNKSVATVNQNGKITGVAVGKANITASWKNEASGKTYSAKASVTVEAAGITLSTYKISSFYVGETRTIKATASSGSVQWKSSNTSVAKVDSNGVVTAVGGGTATITATSGSYSETCSVTVTQPGISIPKSSASMTAGETITLSATVTPSGTAVTWSSDNTKVATVSGGKVTGVTPGTATIRAKITYAGKTYEATCTVTVGKPSVSLSSNSLSMMPGDSKTLSATTKPSGQSVSWSSDNTRVATVSGGKVTAVAAGSANITAKITCGGQTYSATCKVTVEKPGVTLSATSLSLMPGDSKTLSATTKPSGQSVSWSSSNTSVATVSGGKITAVASGTATITAKFTYNGTEYSQKCTVTVEKPSISLDYSSATITYAEREQDRGTVKLTADVKPDGGEVSWSISDKTVAEISPNGKTCTVKAKQSGSATVTATYKVNGTSVKDTCEITVKKASSTLKIYDVSWPPQSSLNDFYFNASVKSNYQLTRLELSGTAVSVATGLSASDSGTYIFTSNVYETTSTDSTNMTNFLKDYYRGLYDLYGAIAGLFGADDSLAITATGTFYDSSGNSTSCTITYTLTEK